MILRPRRKHSKTPCEGLTAQVAMIRPRSDETGLNDNFASSSPHSTSNYHDLGHQNSVQSDKNAIRHGKLQPKAKERPDVICSKDKNYRTKLGDSSNMSKIKVAAVNLVERNNQAVAILHPGLDIQCAICSKHFKRAHSLKSHVSAHHAERKFACEICGKSFARQTDLARHTRLAKHKAYTTSSPVNRPSRPDPLIVALAEKATLDPELRDLMRRIADAQAPKHELDFFQGVINELEVKVKRNIASRVPATGSAPIDGSTIKGSAFEKSRLMTGSQNPLLIQSGISTALLTSTESSSFRSSIDKEGLLGYKKDLAPSASAQQNPVVTIEFTDSGYASAPNHGYIPIIQDIDPPIEITDSLSDTFEMFTNQDDAETIYSAAVSIMDDAARQSISDVCKDIFSKIEENVGAQNWQSLSRSIPGLIKAFAIQLGSPTLDDPSTSQRVMYFIHRHHQ